MSHESNADLLIEIGCEELPPRAIDQLRETFFNGITDGLEKAQITFDRAASRQFSTPRRIAVLIADVPCKQPDQLVERRGPAVAAAFDSDGNPTPAAKGFAGSVGAEVADLDRMSTDKGEWLFYRQSVKGLALGELLFDMIEAALRALPVPRPMRWSDNDFSFVRPVHWLVVMHGSEVLPGSILGKEAGRHTFAHRIHAPGPHDIAQASDYETTLLNGKVIADAGDRKDAIKKALYASDANVLIDPGLLKEVNNLVEWPMAVVCGFDEEFLEVPHAALIATMQDHQKFFPVSATDAGDSGDIANRFIAISNIESTDVDQVRVGYERVVRPRLADSRFFLEQDLKKPLSDYTAQLDKVVFQKKIGSIGDKTRRIAGISEKLSGFMGLDPQTAVRAAQLCKSDLVTQMVGEFPELQGFMGAYYAQRSGETEAASRAIGEHYYPRFAGDHIPASVAGQIVSIADRCDTLVAIFSVGMAPTGNKDPFALRRSALGLLRILSESELSVPLSELLSWAGECLAENQPFDSSVLEEVESFIIQRARSYLQDQGYEINLVSAALSSPWKHIPDLNARLEALRLFMGREEAQSLAGANKRIGNILRKSEENSLENINVDLLDLNEEKQLFDALERISKKIKPHLEESKYALSLEALAELKGPLDSFFDSVMVMDDDPALRRNRLALLASLKGLFDEIADLSVLD